jgi:hypothetical protein
MFFVTNIRFSYDDHHNDHRHSPSLARNASRRGVSSLLLTHHSPAPSLARNTRRRGLLPVFRLPPHAATTPTSRFDELAWVSTIDHLYSPLPTLFHPPLSFFTTIRPFWPPAPITDVFLTPTTNNYAFRRAIDERRAVGMRCTSFWTNDWQWNGP